jgi:hypothetical protein
MFSAWLRISEIRQDDHHLHLVLIRPCCLVRFCANAAVNFLTHLTPRAASCGLLVRYFSYSSYMLFPCNYYGQYLTIQSFLYWLHSGLWCGRYISVGIGYRLDGRGIEFRFPAGHEIILLFISPWPTLGLIPYLLFHWAPGLFPRW